MAQNWPLIVHTKIHITRCIKLLLRINSSCLLQVTIKQGAIFAALLLYKLYSQRQKKRNQADISISVLWVCPFARLVVFLWSLLIRAECRLHFYCQHWWKEERGRESKRHGCQEGGISDGLRMVPNVGAKLGDSQSCCPLTRVFAAGPLSPLSQIPKYSEQLLTEALQHNQTLRV